MSRSAEGNLLEQSNLREVATKRLAYIVDVIGNQQGRRELGEARWKYKIRYQGEWKGMSPHDEISKWEGPEYQEISDDDVGPGRRFEEIIV